MNLRTLTLASLLVSSPLYAADYVVDTKGAHASINFRISHLGYAFVTGRFNKFEGSFSYDSENIEASRVSLDIDPSSVDSNHAERDKHIRGADFLDVDTYPEAKFVSSSFTKDADGGYTLLGDLTLRGRTNPVEIAVSKVGEGDDPWGGYRAGFEGTTTLTLKDYGIDYNLGPAAEVIYMDLVIEGIRQ